MKATRQETPFVPVVLTLETQEEVDAIHALFNQGMIADTLPPISNAYKHLSGLASSKAGEFHLALCKLLK